MVVSRRVVSCRYRCTSRPRSRCACLRTPPSPSTDGPWKGREHGGVPTCVRAWGKRSGGRQTYTQQADALQALARHDGDQLHLAEEGDFGGRHARREGEGHRGGFSGQAVDHELGTEFLCRSPRSSPYSEYTTAHDSGSSNKVVSRPTTRCGRRVLVGRSASQWRCNPTPPSPHISRDR